ncbi:MAG: hypothetical protein H6858_04650 [Rhodospirillales bacterium]|nr:hypothetical protein [Alphaproteobacteria bacterium]MCB1840119.1 hypothetical protein [Alphaproteobacteria bacterium]MCB9976875.1 hypothetical protein [Rhodospirillales bacterium]
MRPLIKTSLLTLAALTVAAPAFASTALDSSKERMAVNECSRSAEGKTTAEDWSKVFNACLQSRGFKIDGSKPAKTSMNTIVPKIPSHPHKTN